MKNILCAGALLLSLGSVAHATERGNEAVAVSESTAVAAAAAVAANRTDVRTNVRNTNVVAPRATGGRGGAGGGGGQANVQVDVQQGGGYNGGGYRELRQAPGLAVGFMQPPSCGFAASAGNSTYTNGANILGLSFETESCRKHRLATALANMGRTDAAVALLCTMGEIQEALALTSSPCPSPAPTVQTVAAIAPASAAPTRARPAYCRPGIANSECQ